MGVRVGAILVIPLALVLLVHSGCAGEEIIELGESGTGADTSCDADTDADSDTGSAADAGSDAGE